MDTPKMEKQATLKVPVLPSAIVVITEKASFKHEFPRITH